MVGMAARVDLASAAVVANNANSAQKITTTKVQIVGSSTGSTATKELPCTKNRKSNTPIGVISHIGPPEFPFWILFSFDSVWSALFFDEFFVNLFW